MPFPYFSKKCQQNGWSEAQRDGSTEGCYELLIIAKNHYIRSNNQVAALDIPCTLYSPARVQKEN